VVSITTAATWHIDFLLFLLIRQHDLWNDAELRIVAVIRFIWYFAANNCFLTLWCT